MKSGFHRLQTLRMKNDAKGFLMDEMRPRFDRLAARYENGTAPKAVSAYQLFQTPEHIAERMASMACISPSCRILEPSAGLGRLLGPILAQGGADILAVEKDAALAGGLFRSFPSVRLAQGDFLARHFGEFDRIVMNPPFHMRSDIAHIRHALAHLAPGGILVGLCLSTHHREKALRDSCDTWEILPAGTFSKEGTQVETVLFRIHKLVQP